MKNFLVDDFYQGKRSDALPVAINGIASIVSGDYAGQSGAVVAIDTSASELRFLIEFGDGTDELVPLSNLKINAHFTS